jgi:acylphosphatase
MAGNRGSQARLRAIVAGVVQGVNFRYYTQRTALQLGLTGWVRNLGDGSVEIVAEGHRQALESLAAFLRVGPPSAQVTDLRIEWEEPSGEFAAFDIRYT